MTENDHRGNGENPFKLMLGVFLTIVVLHQITARGITFTEVYIVANAIFIAVGTIYLLLPGGSDDDRTP